MTTTTIIKKMFIQKIGEELINKLVSSGLTNHANYAKDDEFNFAIEQKTFF